MLTTANATYEMTRRVANKRAPVRTLPANQEAFRATGPELIAAGGKVDHDLLADMVAPTTLSAPTITAAERDARKRALAAADKRAAKLAALNGGGYVKFRIRERKLVK